jgi:multiple sugar transport system permease protein
MMQVTGIFVTASVAGQLVFGMLIAALVCEGERRRLPGAAIVRAIVLVGWVLPGVVIGIIWKLLLDESGAGIMAYASSLLGARNPMFLSAPLPALVWVTIANIWRGTAFSMIMQYAGMKTVPPELYEAATVDGAGALQKFRYITLPMLRGILLINVVLITIATLNTFDMVLPLTGGGPGRATEVIALYIYHLVFSEFQFGRGAAVAVVLMLIGLALSACYARMLQKERAA